MLRDVLGRRGGGAEAARQAGAARPDRAVASAPPRRRQDPVSALAGVISRHWLFCVALGLATVPRLFAILGFRPAILFRMDTYDYLWNAVHLTPNAVNPSGYALVLALLRPFHSLTLIVILQSLAGLVIALLVYATLRHWGVADWIATLAAAPVLFAAPELLLEQLIMADLLAFLLMIAAFAVLLMRRSPSVWRSATAGLLMGASTAVRPTTLPLILLMAIYLLIVRAGWRRACALLVAGALPVLAYMSWFAAATGSFNLTDSNGLFLWSRTMSFANCAVIKPPADLRALCPEVQPHSVARPPGAPRLQPTKYLWDHRAWQWQPPSTGPVPDASAFTPANNSRALQFAVRAIEAQPLAYARVVSADTLKPFFQSISFLFPTGIHGGLPKEYVPYALAGVREYAGTTAAVAAQPGQPPDGEDHPAVGAGHPGLPARDLPSRAGVRPDPRGRAGRAADPAQAHRGGRHVVALSGHHPGASRWPSTSTPIVTPCRPSRWPAWRWPWPSGSAPRRLPRGPDRRPRRPRTAVGRLRRRRRPTAQPRQRRPTARPGDGGRQHGPGDGGRQHSPGDGGRQHGAGDGGRQHGAGDGGRRRPRQPRRPGRLTEPKAPMRARTAPARPGDRDSAGRPAGPAGCGTVTWLHPVLPRLPG